MYVISKPGLKLRCSGVHAGEHFAAVLGAQQSTLESVLLKRRLMGPSWFTLACPTRIEAGAQVRLSMFSPGLWGYSHI